MTCGHLKDVELNNEQACIANNEQACIARAAGLELRHQPPPTQLDWEGRLAI